MKMGLAISAVILLVVGIAAFTLTRGVPDPPTSATAAKNLQKVAPPAGLASVWESEEPEASADGDYRKLIEIAQENAKALARPDPPSEVVEQLIGKLVDGMAAGKVSDGFLDEQIPFKPGLSADFGPALEVIPSAVINRAAKTAAGDKGHAVSACLALFAFGQRLFEHDTRLYNRWQGLMIMDGAGAQLFEWHEQVPEGEARLTGWAKYIQGVKAAWGPKMQIVNSVEPHIGDLVNMARNEKDPSFRIEAVLMLGVVKYNPGHRGNARAIQDAIDDAKKSVDPQLAKAGQAADAFTREELHRLR